MTYTLSLHDALPICSSSWNTLWEKSVWPLISSMYFDSTLAFCAVSLHSQSQIHGQVVANCSFEHEEGRLAGIAVCKSLCESLPDRKSTRLTTGTNAHLVSRLLLEQKQQLNSR